MIEKNYGVLTEQGYIMGQGLGFAPIKESELNKNEEEEKKDEEKK